MSSGPGVGELWRAMRHAEARVGGGEGCEGVYGSITEAGTARVLGALAGLGGGGDGGGGGRGEDALGPGSVVLDVGAGLGRPLLHAAVAMGCSGGLGVEVDPVKCAKADAFLRLTLARLAARGDPGGVLACLGAPERRPRIFCADMGELRTVEPATHVYSFWEGIPRSARAAVGALVRKSRSVRGVAVVQRAVRGGAAGAAGAAAEQEMADLGFGDLRLEASFPVTMSGSGRSFVAYVFARSAPPPGTAAHFPPEAALDRLAAAAAAPGGAAAALGPRRRGRRRPAEAPPAALRLGRAKRPRGLPPAAPARKA